MKLLSFRKKSLSIRIFKTLGICENNYQSIRTKNVFKKRCSSHREIRTEWFRISRGQIESLEFNSLQIRASYSFHDDKHIIVHESPMVRKRYLTIFFFIVFVLFFRLIMPNLSVANDVLNWFTKKIMQIRS